MTSEPKLKVMVEYKIAGMHDWVPFAGRVSRITGNEWPLRAVVTVDRGECDCLGVPPGCNRCGETPGRITETHTLTLERAREMQDDAFAQAIDACLMDTGPDRAVKYVERHDIASLAVDALTGLGGTE